MTFSEYSDSDSAADGSASAGGACSGADSSEASEGDGVGVGARSARRFGRGLATETRRFRLRETRRFRGALRRRGGDGQDLGDGEARRDLDRDRRDRDRGRGRLRRRGGRESRRRRRPWPLPLMAPPSCRRSGRPRPLPLGISMRNGKWILICSNMFQPSTAKTLPIFFWLFITVFASFWITKQHQKLRQLGEASIRLPKAHTLGVHLDLSSRAQTAG